MDKALAGWLHGLLRAPAPPEPMRDASDFHDILYTADIRLALDVDSEAESDVVKLQVGCTTGPDDDLHIYVHAVDESGEPIKLRRDEGCQDG